MSDATLDAPMLDAPLLDAPLLDAPMLDAPLLDAPMLDAPLPDVPGVDSAMPDAGFDAGSCPLGTSCDDGNPCTWGETCVTADSCGGGTTLDCNAMDTICRDFTCDGTPSCSSVPRNLGMTCDDGNAATTGDVCLADGTCMGTMGGCSLPGDACANGSQSRDRCSGARVIGRSAASTTYVTTASTCSGNNRFDDCSWDAGDDHAYRIWMRTGEQIAVSVNKRNTCHSGYSATLKLYEPSDCTSVSCGSDIWCHDFAGNGEVFTHTAGTTGWHVVVVDGSTAFDDEGEYTLNVTLSGCSVAGCEC